jgi:hypothetical protein
MATEVKIKYTEFNYSKQINHSSGANIGVLHKEPFHNCQICAIGNFAGFLSSLADNNIAQDYLVEIHKETNKTQLLIDVKDSWANRIESIFNKNEIIFKQPYTNNTGSHMIMYMLQYTKMVVRVKEERKSIIKKVA